MAQSSQIEQREAGLEDVWRFRAERYEYREEWGTVWRENSLDILLCPGYQGVGARHDHVGVPFYSAVWNLLDFPASVVPFQKADRSVDTQEVPGYDPILVDGVPAHIQIVGWRFQDEEALSATEVISEALRDTVDPRL
ncbi:unnamed protein product [Zymoseptoria tritici ST99CH_3D7]|nr:unnamed protein product [Zymoseptoria tritici ST99CH_3D7]